MNGDGNFTVKEIVIEIRDTVKELAAKVDRIDEKGSIGTRDILQDHERRIRLNEDRLAQPVVTRADLHAVKNEIAALQLWQAGLAAVATWKKWQVSAALAIGGLASGLVGSVATIIWLNHG